MSDVLGKRCLEEVPHPSVVPSGLTKTLRAPAYDDGVKMQILESLFMCGHVFCQPYLLIGP